MLYNLIKKFLFLFNPETSHKLIMKYLLYITPIIKNNKSLQNTYKPIDCMGITFKNRLGLAAGIDKNGEYLDVFEKMGFGFIEIGTVTLKPQIGNPKPRLFRLIPVNGIINRMGFNNLGIKQVIKNIKKSTFTGILGVNIGKNKNTSLENAQQEYLTCIEKIYYFASYITINISSPNTPLLRNLQHDVILNSLLKGIKKKQKQLDFKYSKYVPIVIKISPDLSKKELINIAQSLIKHNIDGVIATNTTTDYSLITGLKNSNEKGGLSGRPLQNRSTYVIKILANELKGKIPIIGVGGIDSLISAKEKIISGASLLQIYSGLIYKGPSIIKDILNFI